tara:strand:- start:379 stop:696 length:318 start_codon:yes stop_codon:yes gene_type:complete
MLKTISLLMYSFLGGIFALFFSDTFIANREGQPPKFIIKWDEFFINGSFYIGSRHIHHWVIFSLLLIFLIILYLLFPSNSLILFFGGFSVYMILHGLRYNDCFVF